MTNIDELLAQFCINAMFAADASEEAVEEMLAALNARIEAGDNRARAAARNRWGTTMAPSRVVERLRPELQELDEEAITLLPRAVIVLLRRGIVREQLAAAECRTAATAPPVTPEQINGAPDGYEGFARVVTIMRDAKLTDRTCNRASVAIIQQAARLIARSDQPRICDDIVDREALRQAGLYSLVCKTKGWDPTATHEQLAAAWRTVAGAGEHERHVPWITWVPEVVVIDPPQLPRGWVHGAGMEVYPTTWDAFPADPFYASFIRALAPDEQPYFTLRDDQFVPTLPLWEDISSLRKNDSAFNAAFKKAENRARIVDGYRARHEERLHDLIAAGGPIERQRDVELVEWVAGLDALVISDLEAWDAWRPWGTLISALKAYLGDDLWETGSVVRCWAYLLYGRHLQSEAEFPTFIRRELFDWHQMPVSSNMYGAVRYLVPKDQLGD